MADLQKLEDNEMNKSLCPYTLPVYLAVCAVPLFISGLALTGISVAVYTKPYQGKTKIDFLLAALSVFEFLFLLASFIVFSLSPLPILTCPKYRNHYPLFKSISLVYIYPLTHVTKYMCVCISIMISVQKWIAVFFPFKVSYLCSMKRTKWLLGFSFFFSIVAALPRFEEKISDYGRPVINKAWKDNFFITFIDGFDNKVFNAFIVFLSLFVVNISIICFLKCYQLERMRMTSRPIQDRRTDLMLLAVLLSYVLTHFPSMVIEYDFVDSQIKTLLPLQIRSVRKEISNFFMCCHPLFSFADYMIFSEKYRGTVKSIFCRNTPNNSPILLQAL